MSETSDVYKRQVFLGALAQGDVGQPLVGVDAAVGGVHRAGMLHRHPVGLYHLGGHGAGHERRQQAVQMEMQPGLLMHRAVEQLEFGVDLSLIHIFWIMAAAFTRNDAKGAWRILSLIHI